MELKINPFFTSSKGWFGEWMAKSDPCCLGRAWQGLNTMLTTYSVFFSSLHWSLEDEHDQSGANSSMVPMGEEGPPESRSSSRRKARSAVCRAVVPAAGHATPALLCQPIFPLSTRNASNGITNLENISCLEEKAAKGKAQLARVNSVGSSCSA